MKALMILNHAPDYREPFLRELGSKVSLTVVAQPCNADRLTPPDDRVGYQYIEIPSTSFLGVSWQPGLGRLLRNDCWDIVCVSSNLRHLPRLFFFLTNHRLRKKWIWWGLIFGEQHSRLLGVLRKYLLSNSAACLVHGKSVAWQVKNKFGVHAVSYNNTEVKRHEFRQGVFDDGYNGKDIHLLFVGTYKPRKQIERLVELAGRRQDVTIRVVGPGMENLTVPVGLKHTGRIETFGRTVGADLNQHFDWADIVASPGNVGLLVMNAARHGKGIVIDNNSYHGPEHWLAVEAEQPFISFADKEQVDTLLNQVRAEPLLIKQWGKSLQEKAISEYTIESMAETHLMVFQSIAAGSNANS